MRDERLQGGKNLWPFLWGFDGLKASYYREHIRDPLGLNSSEQLLTVVIYLRRSRKDEQHKVRNSAGIKSAEKARLSLYELDRLLKPLDSHNRRVALLDLHFEIEAFGKVSDRIDKDNIWCKWDDRDDPGRSILARKHIRGVDMLAVLVLSLLSSLVPALNLGHDLLLERPLVPFATLSFHLALGQVSQRTLTREFCLERFLGGLGGAPVVVGQHSWSHCSAGFEPER
jgi:hypothetical protein